VRFDASAITIVLLPGMDGTGMLFRPWNDAKPENVELRVIDYPTDVALAYEDLLPLVRARLPQDRPYVLLAESFSGPLGLMLAAEAADRLCGLILCCTFAKNPQPVLKLLRPFVTLVKFAGLPAVLARLGHRALFGRFANTQTQAALSASLRHLHPAVLGSRMRAVLDVDVTPLLSHVDVPVLYLSAEEDRVVPPSALRHLAQALPQMQVVRIAAPHMLLQTMPGAAWQAVLSFFGGVGTDV